MVIDIPASAGSTRKALDRHVLTKITAPATEGSLS